MGHHAFTYQGFPRTNIYVTKIGEASKRRGTDKLTMRSISVEIAAARRQMATRGR